MSGGVMDPSAAQGDDYARRLAAAERGMRSRRRAPGPRDTPPMPAPSTQGPASWSEGLDSSDATGRDISQWLQTVFRQHQGKEPPAALIRQLDELGDTLTGEQPREPAYGPGLWSTMPQRAIRTMSVARPLDLNGAPSDIEIDLMMMHAIRMGERLCRTYPSWSHALPACWIRHDYIIEETFALACYQDLIAANGNGGFYAPTLQADIAGALNRIQTEMKAEGADRKRHEHHLSDKDSLARAASRLTEYTRWATNAKPWDTRPKGKGWRGDDGFADVMTEYGWPVRATPAPPADDGAIGERIREWEEWYDDLTRRAASATPGVRDGAMVEAEGDAEEMHDRWEEWSAAERDAHDRLDRSLATGLKRLSDREHPLRDGDARRLRELTSRAGGLLAKAGDPSWPDTYSPQPIAMQETLRHEIDALSELHDDSPLDRMRRILDQARRAFQGGDS